MTYLLKALDWINIFLSKSSSSDMNPGAIIGLLTAVVFVICIFPLIIFSKEIGDAKKPLETKSGKLIDISDGEKVNALIASVEWKYYLFEMDDGSRIRLKKNASKSANDIVGEHYTFTYNGELLRDVVKD